MRGALTASLEKTQFPPAFSLKEMSCRCLFIPRVDEREWHVHKQTSEPGNAHSKPHPLVTITLGSAILLDGLIAHLKVSQQEEGWGVLPGWDVGARVVHGTPLSTIM